MISAKLTKKKKNGPTHINKNLPSDAHSRGHSPSTLVQHMLDLVRPPNLGQQPFGGWELLVRCTNLRFTVAGCREGRVGWGQVPQGCHDHRCSNSSTCDQSLGLLEGPCEFTNIFGQLLRRISSLP